jgi:hypothetical protein
MHLTDVYVLMSTGMNNSCVCTARTSGQFYNTFMWDKSHGGSRQEDTLTETLKENCRKL